LIEGLALPFVDRAGVAVAELIEAGGVEVDRLRLLAVEPDRDMRSVDRLDGADAAIRPEYTVGRFSAKFSNVA